MEASAAPRPAGTPRRPAPVPARLLRLAGDERLVVHVRRGSQEAFEVLYDRHHRGILSFCRHMLGSHEEAEDAVQHTFMAAYRDLARSDKEIHLRAWLYAIARNRCLSMLRARREVPSDDLDEPATVGLSAQVEQRQDLRDLLADVADLPENQRAALVLSELGAMGHDEIASVLGCPTAKVKALVFQARSSLNSSRDARDVSCDEIREMLATLRGGALRRSTLRRHVRDCPGCQAFASEVRRQRAAMAILLPVAPTLGLKESALAAAFGSGSAGAAAAGAGAGAVAAATGVAGGTTAAAGGAGVLAVKVLVVAALAGGGAVGVKSAVDSDPPPPAPATSRPTGASKPPAPVAPGLGAESSDDKLLGRENALTRGKGRKRGLLGTQPRKSSEKKAERKAASERASARSKRARSKAKSRAKTKLKAKRKASAPRLVRPVAPKPRPQPAPKPAPQRKSQPAAPPPAATPAPTPEPSGNGNGNGKG